MEPEFVLEHRSIPESPNQTVNVGEDGTASAEKATIKRHLGLFSGISFIIGMIIGSGIFVSPKGVLKETQSIGLCLIVWAICGIISLLGALCYAEIGIILPFSGSELVYMKEGIGSVHARSGDILAFVFNWANIFVLQPSSIAILSLTFSTYFLSGIMDSCGPPAELVKMMSIFAIGILGTVNALSVRAANKLNIIFVISKTVTILVIIIGGLVRLGQGYTENLKTGFSGDQNFINVLQFLIMFPSVFRVGTTNKPLGVALAFYSGLWAYGGWSSLNSVTEELKNPKKNLWMSIIVALPSVIILYILTNISYFTVMNKASLLSSNAVAVTWGDTVLGPVAAALPILISLSALGSANGSIFSAARYCMVGARFGYFPEVFACIQKQRRTPLPGIIFLTIISIVYCIPSDIENLIGFFSFVSWFFSGLTFVATICCKFTKRTANRIINVPIPFIILIILVSLYLVIVPAISDPNIGFLIAVLILLLSLIFYYLFVFRRMELKLMKKLNYLIQQFFDLKKSTANIDS